MQFRLRTLLIVLTLLGVYLGAYRALLLPLPKFYSTPPDYPQYRLGGRVSVILFHPIAEAEWRFDHAAYALKKRLRGEDPQLPSYENYPMFRFTIRDLLWLMVVVGLSLGFWQRGQSSAL